MSSDGKVSFVRPGKSNVVVTSKYGGITDTCVIIVDSIHVESFELKQHEMTIDISKSGRLEWIYAPDDASQTMPDITALMKIYYIFIMMDVFVEKRRALLGSMRIWKMASLSILV